jgi:RNA polymerase sigma-70 factor, ECF subfamily
VQKTPSGTSPQAEFAEFMRAYQDMVFSTAFRLTASEAHAQDIAQEVFLKAYGQFDRLRNNAAAGGWLKTVATNLSLNHLSRYRRRWRFFSELRSDDSGEEEPEADWLAPQGKTDELFDAVDLEDRRQRVATALARLPEHQRVPLVLYHFEEMSYEDIAARLQVSLAKLKTDIHRARVQLARSLIDCWPT